MRYLDYMEEHPGENLSWCKPYTDGNENYLVMYNGEAEIVKVGNLEVDTRDRHQLAEALETLARTVNPDYGMYSGYSDEEIALEAMREVGCSECPWKYDCDAMGEEVCENDYR